MDNNKLQIQPYKKEFVKIFEKNKKEIFDVCGNKIEVHHVGSTAVLGLGGKGIVDILIAISDWNIGKEIIEKLKTLGFTHIHPKERGRIFLSEEPPYKHFGSVHLHLVKKNNKDYQEILTFRDYLNNNPKRAQEYFQLKTKLVGSSRKLYAKNKGKYIKKIINKIL